MTTECSLSSFSAASPTGLASCADVGETDNDEDWLRFFSSTRRARLLLLNSRNSSPVALLPEYLPFDHRPLHCHEVDNIGTLDYSPRFGCEIGT